MMEWISIKDRLPENKQKVIFYVKDRDEIFCGNFIDGRFEENLDSWFFLDEYIPYWMPLPNIPEDDK